ncbi:MAG: AEC family transporter [Planctomycetota bacterium]|jgi:predicted permease
MLHDSLTNLIEIFGAVIAPVLAIVTLGALLQRLRPMAIPTLVTVNLYVFIPAFLFQSVRNSGLDFTTIGDIGLGMFLPMIAVGAFLYYAMRSRKLEARVIGPVIVGSLFFNGANFGIPVAKLAFGQPGVDVQSFVLMYINTTIFFVGYIILALAQGRGPLAALGYFRLPMFYVIVIGLAMRHYDAKLPAFAESAFTLVAGGMVPVALVTLGAQMTAHARWPRWRLITPVVLIKLAAMPAATALAVWALDLWPWPGAQIIIAMAGPTAVNTLLLTIELDGEADVAADCVFWSTLLAAFTVTVLILILRAIEPGLPAPA